MQDLEGVQCLHSMESRLYRRASSMLSPNVFLQWFSSIVSIHNWHGVSCRKNVLAFRCCTRRRSSPSDTTGCPRLLKRCYSSSSRQSIKKRNEDAVTRGVSHFEASLEMPIQYEPNSDTVTIDRANEYASALNSTYTSDYMAMWECCEERCSARISRLALAQFRCQVVGDIAQGCELNKLNVRNAIYSQIKRKCRPHADGTVSLETVVAGVPTCHLYYLSALCCGRKMFTSVMNDIGNPAPPSSNLNRYEKDSFLRAIGRVANKIRDFGQPHPVDRSIMVPTTEKRRHFLRSGPNGGSVLSRRHIRMFFGVAIRTHKASSFMKCDACIAMKTFAEDRSLLFKQVNHLLAEWEKVKGNSTRGKYVEDAAHRMAEDRLSYAKYKAFQMENRRRLKEGGGDMEDDEEGVSDDDEDQIPPDVEVPAELQEEEQDDPDTPLANAENAIDELHRKFLSGELKDVKAYLRGVQDGVKGLAHMEAAMKRFHYQCIRNERVIQYAAQEAAASCPDEVCAVIIDGCGKERTKLPFYPERAKGVAEDSKLIKCPLVGIQEAIPYKPSENKKHRGPSDFSLYNHDYIIALEWTQISGADLYASLLLQFLFEKERVPRVLVIILDNARVNKGEPFMAWLSLIMLFTNIVEVNLYFPTKGHTHSTLDAHFGSVKPKKEKIRVLTPQDLQRHLASLPNTAAHLKLAIYQIANQLKPLTITYKNRLSQGHFVLYKPEGEANIHFKYTASLRFTEHFSSRIRDPNEMHAKFLHMDEEDRDGGFPVFNRDGEDLLTALRNITENAEFLDATIPIEQARKLAKQIPALLVKGRREDQVLRELKDFEVAIPNHDLTLAEVLKRVKENGNFDAIGAQRDADGETFLDEIMRQMGKEKRKKHLRGDTSIQAMGTADARCRERTTRAVLGVLKAAYPTVEEEFVKAASQAGPNGGPLRGFASILSGMQAAQAPGAFIVPAPVTRGGGSRASSLASGSTKKTEGSAARASKASHSSNQKSPPPKRRKAGEGSRKPLVGQVEELSGGVEEEEEEQDEGEARDDVSMKSTEASTSSRGRQRKVRVIPEAKP